jgi:hypothetical protein
MGARPPRLRGIEVLPAKLLDPVAKQAEDVHSFSTQPGFLPKRSESGFRPETSVADFSAQGHPISVHIATPALFSVCSLLWTRCDAGEELHRWP